MINASNASALSQLNFSIFIVANNSIVLNQASIVTVSIGIISKNNITVASSVINTTGQSCRTNSGLGRGAIIQYDGS